MKDKKALKKIIKIIEGINNTDDVLDLPNTHRMKRKDIVSTIDTVISILEDDTDTYTKEDAIDLLFKIRNNTL
jgi:hypothetical protein|nr:MAG TPA: hypothetical protein [Bacteriophage sp.]DAW53290.1 MAG TPA: hypothetical protein [Caudoviricetes sp.]